MFVTKKGSNLRRPVRKMRKPSANTVQESKKEEEKSEKPTAKKVKKETLEAEAKE